LLLARPSTIDWRIRCYTLHRMGILEAILSSFLLYTLGTKALFNRILTNIVRRTGRLGGHLGLTWMIVWIASHLLLLRISVILRMAWSALPCAVIQIKFRAWGSPIAQLSQSWERARRIHALISHLSWLKLYLARWMLCTDLRHMDISTSRISHSCLALAHWLYLMHTRYLRYNRTGFLNYLVMVVILIVLSHPLR
jgi:hypothetical protein